MANTRSARKRIRSNERKRLRNRAVRSAVRTKVSRARRALLGAATAEAAPVNSEAELREAIRALDRAAEKGILHRNNVRRRKSRLASMAARLAAAGAGTEDAAAVRTAAAGGAKGRTAKGAGRPAGAKGTSKTAVKAPAKPARSAAAGSTRGGGSAPGSTTRRGRKTP